MDHISEFWDFTYPTKAFLKANKLVFKFHSFYDIINFYLFETRQLFRGIPIMTNKIKSFTLIILILITGFKAKTINGLIEKNVDLEAVPYLSQLQIVNDVNILIQFINNGYGGKDILPDSEVNELINQLKNISKDAKIQNSNQFCIAIAKATETMRDFHLTVNLGMQSCGRAWPRGSVGSNISLNNQNSTWSLEQINLNNNKINILGIKKMTNKNSEDWKGFLEAIDLILVQKNSFIIDLRGNPGGDLRMPIELVRKLYGIKFDDPLPLPNKKIYRKRAPESWVLLANAFWLQKQNYEINNQTPPEYLLQEYINMKGYLTKSLNNEIPWLETEISTKFTPNFEFLFNKNIYVLIDRECGSSCELTLEALENHPYAHTVGESTAGVVHFGNLGKLFLPDSHLVVNIPTQGAIYSDGRFVEKTGYQPKYMVPRGTNALEFTVNNLLKAQNISD